MWRFSEKRPAKVVTRASDEPDQILPILDGLHVLDTAGHTPGHLSFYQPERRVLFAGDSIVERNKVPSPVYGINC
ncbi:MAG: MBL fold metallo-hydrolase [Bellilinea sp.]